MTSPFIKTKWGKAGTDFYINKWNFGYKMYDLQKYPLAYKL